MHRNIIPTQLGVQKHMVRRLVPSELQVESVGDEEGWTALFQLFRCLLSVV